MPYKGRRWAHLALSEEPTQKIGKRARDGRIGRGGFKAGQIINLRYGKRPSKLAGFRENTSSDKEESSVKGSSGIPNRASHREATAPVSSKNSTASYLYNLLYKPFKTNNNPVPHAAL